MADINADMLKEKLYPVAKALFCISETCVEVSKQHISEADALDKIRKYLYDTDVIGSRLRVDQLIEECTEPTISDWLRAYLKMPLNSTEDSCMANNIDGHVYFVNNMDELRSHADNTDRVAETVERTKKYIKKHEKEYEHLTCPECNAPLEVYYDGPRNGDPNGTLIRHCEKCHCDWENELHKDCSESELTRKFWG